MLPVCVTTFDLRIGWLICARGRLMDERLNRVVSHDGMVVGVRSCWGGRSRGHCCGFWCQLVLYSLAGL